MTVRRHCDGCALEIATTSAASGWRTLAFVDESINLERVVQDLCPGCVKAVICWLREGFEALPPMPGEAEQPKDREE